MREQWVRAAVCLGGDPARAGSAADDLERRYAEPHRRYHTAVHIQTMLAVATTLAIELELSEPDRALLTLAICAHDVIYDARPGLDEAASAAWAISTLRGAGVASAAAERVAELVGTTETHQAHSDLVAAALLDADLAVLGGSAAEYERYRAAVRAEYDAVSDVLWRTGRARVVGALLERDPLYRTEFGRRCWQAGARRNLSTELAALAALAAESV